MKFKILFTLFLSLLVFGTANAQKVALKTNLLYDVALSPNIGIEAKLAPK